MSRIKVLIVDDSAVVRQMLSKMLSEDDEIEVVGTAIDPIFAMQKIMKDPPDVITLDVEMPRMDGLTFLEKLMKAYSIPVVMVSAFTKQGCDTTLKALILGAVDFIEKPARNTPEYLGVIKQEIIGKVKNAARVNLKACRTGLSGVGTAAVSQQGKIERPVWNCASKVVAIGASTGGVAAVSTIINSLRPDDYTIFITLHMPATFTRSFAERLGSTGWSSSEAGNGQEAQPHHIYVAPGGRNMIVERRNGVLFTKIKECDKTDIYKPNVNKTFASMARAAGPEAIGVILTGMGDDGAQGLLMMKQAGALTIAQNKETSMVFGMPQKAIEAGAVDYTLALEQIAGKIRQYI